VVAVNDVDASLRWSRQALEQERKAPWRSLPTGRRVVPHCDGQRAIFQAVNRGDVGMVERSQHLGLTPEARHALGVSSECLRQDFQRHFAVQLRVSRAIDFSHSARTDSLHDVVVAKRLANHWDGTPY